MCVFCQIITKEVPADIIFEDQNFVVFKDINPRAPVHLLIVTKEHWPAISALTAEQAPVIGQMIYRAKLLAEEQGISESGYKLVFNNGEDGGQIINHLHLHLLGGKKLGGLV